MFQTHTPTSPSWLCLVCQRRLLLSPTSVFRAVSAGVKSIEDFVQQTGRAGRDGEEAETVAFTRPSSDAQEIKG